MIQNETMYARMRTDISDPTRGDAQGVFRSMNVLDAPWVAAEDISAAVAWPACDNDRNCLLPVDVGLLLR